MTSEQARRAQAAWLTYAADVAETLTDDEIASLGRRLRATTGEWLRQVAKAHVEKDQFDVPNIHPAQWVMRLLLEERGHTFRTNESVQLGPRVKTDDTEEASATWE